MILSAHRNSKKQGDAGLGNAIAWFTKEGYTVCIPLTDSQEFDLVVEKENQGLSRVQVKTTTSCSQYGRFVVTLKTCGGNRSGAGKTKRFSSKAADLVFILTSKGEQYLIPANELDKKSSVNLGEKYEQYKIKEVSIPSDRL